MASIAAQKIWGGGLMCSTEGPSIQSFPQPCELEKSWLFFISRRHLHLKDKGHSFEHTNVHPLNREDRWLERGVKEATYVHWEWPSLNRGGPLHQLFPISNAVLSSLPSHINPYSLISSGDLNRSHNNSVYMCDHDIITHMNSGNHPQGTTHTRV